MRQYISQKNFDKDGLLTIIGKDYRYLRNVLRLVPGDMLSVRLPDGSLQNSTVAKVDESAKKIVLQLCADTSAPHSENQPDAKNLVEYWLFMFVPKSSKFDLIVRQATECGVSKIVPVLSEFSQSGAEKMNFRGERLERIVREARQQSGSAVDTKILDCVTVQELCDMWNLDENSDSQKKDEKIEKIEKIEKFACVLYERSDKTVTLKKALEPFGAGQIKKCALVCGAEGGISPAEIDLMMKAGFVPIHFETNILRCETAALYGIASVQSMICF